MTVSKLGRFDPVLDRQIEEITAEINSFYVLAVYSNNAEALAGGLLVGQYYRTGADPDVVCIVH
jgi:hypothetical protein